MTANILTSRVVPKLMDVETMIAWLQSRHLSCYSGGTISLHEQHMGYN